MAYNLILTIVPQGKADEVMHFAQDAGARGGTITRAMGTAKTTILQILGFCDSAKEIVYIVANDDATAVLCDAIVGGCKKFKQPFGILFTIDVLQFATAATFHEGEGMADIIENKSPWRLITFIVNRGYSDDVMDAARKAGATGGTVMTARGTARPGDSKFFGMEIVPEKDMVLILCRVEIANKIIGSVEALECLSKKGSGVAFTMEANNFTLLGTKK